MTDLAGLAGLPEPEIIVPSDFEAILLAMQNYAVAQLPSIAGYVSLETEPANVVLQASGYREVMLRALINDSFRQTLLAKANGAALDHLAAFYDVTRVLNETDDQLRLRTVLEISGRSTGGTVPRYTAKALGASVQVKSAIVWRDSTSPLIRVAILSTDVGGVAGPALIATVQAALDNPSVKMVNDTIVVQSAVTVTQNVVANVWLLSATPQSVFDGLDENLLASWTEETALGFDMTRAWLTARLMRSGIQRVEILTPTLDVTVSPYQAIAMGTVTLNYMGRAD